MRELEDLLNVMARLRDPGDGCPWDLAQTYASIVPHTIEEAYEVADTIERGDLDDLCDELGDLLFQVVFYARIASEEGRFDFRDVVEGISTKMIRRHPHVFSDTRYENVEEQSRAWEHIKAREKVDRGRKGEGALAGVGDFFPALTHAVKLQRKASREGFDWSEPAPVLDKIEEELSELRDELRAQPDQERVAAELGDLLFTCVNAARHLDVDPEQALRSANRRFEERFRRIEDNLGERGAAVRETGQAELEILWEKAKREIDSE